MGEPSIRRAKLWVFALALFTMVSVLAGRVATAQVPWGLCTQWGKGNRDAKINACTSLIETGKYTGDDLANIHVMRGRIYFFSKGEHERAVAEYNEAIRIFPSSCAAFYFRSIASTAKDNIDDAIADLDRAIGFCPTRGEYHRQRSIAHFVKGDMDQVISDLDNAIRLDPDDATALLMRSGAKKSKGDIEGSNADKERLSDLLSRRAK